jgi:hypothetical protein
LCYLRDSDKSGDPPRCERDGPPDHKEATLLMADENLMGRDSLDPSSPAGEDRSAESAILALLLTEHPAQLTMSELVLVLHGDIDLFKPKDAAQRAVRELVGAGLIHHQGKFLVPTRAALYFDRLERE